MARRRNTTTNMETMVTPATGVQQTLSPLNFGSYIPGQFRSIQDEEEHDDESEDECNSVLSDHGKKPATDSYWSATLIGYILGDTPYEKSTEKYVTAMWNFMKKPQILYHTDGKELRVHYYGSVVGEFSKFTSRGLVS
ncbi:hypothetical protein RDI58_007196 [Solanum bulbocastanum]|uniref:Uncharacterized protein n=1 Tax=Solanum bulbocastanum TaxID=147425 RepID=A0AAN8TSD7_SOLBU